MQWSATCCDAQLLFLLLGARDARTRGRLLMQHSREQLQPNPLINGPLAPCCKLQRHDGTQIYCRKCSNTAQRVVDEQKATFHPTKARNTARHSDWPRPLQRQPRTTPPPEITQGSAVAGVHFNAAQNTHTRTDQHVECWHTASQRPLLSHTTPTTHAWKLERQPHSRTHSAAKAPKATPSQQCVTLTPLYSCMASIDRSALCCDRT